MQLTPQERDRLLLFSAAQLARTRLARGLKLNVPEATAIVADTAAEAARDGLRLAEAISAGRSILTTADVMSGVPEVVGTVRVEAMFEDGTRLIVIPDPFGVGDSPNIDEQRPMPGEILIDDPDRFDLVGDDLNRRTALTVKNTSEVPISVTSHFHFFEVNPRLAFDRSQAYGLRLAVPAGSAVRFDPGQSVSVELRDIGGERVVIGFAGLVDGPLDAPGAKEAALAKARATGYLGADLGVGERE